MNMVETNLPILLLKNVILFPYNEIRIEVHKSKEKQVLDDCIKNKDSHILLINLPDPLEENPSIKELPDIGVVGKIKSKIELANGTARIVIIGLSRVNIINYFENNYGYIESFVVPPREYDISPVEETALRRILFKDLNNYIDSCSMMSNSVLGKISGVDNISKLTDIIVSELPIDYSGKLKYLNELNPTKRIKLVIEDLNKEIETAKLENEIESTLKEKIDSSQREYLLREKIRIIKEELGESTIRDSEIETLKNKIENEDLPDKIRNRLTEEFKRYILSSESSPEVTVIRTYIDWLINLPWTKKTEEKYKIQDVYEVLNNTHYGLEDVKNRIVEFVAVMKHTNNINSPIICLTGPSGVGKTTLAKSIAKSLNKKFVKISVGGVSDEAEIVGHRRTYLGANPGKIIQGMKKAGVNNPVFLIDEIDKLTKDYHGDPASALLEVLDKEQNKNFCDNYIEEEFDLSNVLFILTANDVSKIPPALKDRLEIIELSSYTNYDKKEICKKYLIPKLFKEYKIRDYNISIHDNAITRIITSYTKEAGARELSRQIEAICRKVILEDKKDTIIKINNLEEFLGPPKYHHTKNDNSNKFGVINALAYTPYGGDILKISTTKYKGTGNIKITGSIGKVMEESVSVAMSYIKSNAENFEIDYKVFEENDFHIHIEEGATPKDGPSAGITIVTSILSLLKEVIIKNELSMTGEITLRGKILPIGGLKEKIIASSTNGIKTIFIPIDNKIDLEKYPKIIKDKIEIIPVRDYLDIYYYIFNSK